MKRIEDHITLFNSATSPRDIFDRFVKVMHGYGYEQVSYGCATDCPSLGLQKKHGHISSFPADWLEHYAKNNLSEVDPVHIHALQKRTPAFWSQCEKNIPQPSIQLMRDAADVGLKSGIIIPMCDFGNEVSIVSVSRNELPRDETFENLAAINLLSTYFYQGYTSFLRKHESVKLTQREYDVLCWAAEGKTDGEIAMIINLSVPTIRYHWGNIFEKLDVHGRVYAVSKAIKMGLVTPCRIKS